MQAVILAAGKSTRTYPLTLTKPKPLLKVANKTLLEHHLENLRHYVSEVIIVVGYKKELIKKYIGNNYKNLKIRYVTQKQQLGTAHAISILESYIKDRFILLMGDDIYPEEDIRSCINHRYSILISKAINPQNFGVVVEENGILIDFVEKPKKSVSNMVSAAFYLLDKKIFSCIEKIKKSKRNEFELPDAVRLLSKEEKIRCIKSKKWIPIGYPWDLLKADRTLRGNKNIIGKNSKIYGNVKDSSIGNNCIINGYVKNSIIMDSTSIGTNSIVEDSVIGENVNFQGKILAENNVFSAVKNEKINVGRLGAIIADNVNAKNVIVNPGCKIWPGKLISNKIISHDLMR
ncbi:MAG: sugar phosphate nucleotidyltransferase [Nanoarchaeota archaeon]